MKNTPERHALALGQEARKTEVLKVKCGGWALPPTITVKQAAELAGCGVSAAYESCRQSRWPALRISERRIVVATVPFLQMLGLEVGQDQVAQGHDPDHELSSVSEKEGGALSQK